MRTRELRRGTRYSRAGGWLWGQVALSAPAEVDEPSSPYPSRSVIVPSAIVTAASVRDQPKRSFKTSAAIAIPNRIEVSRSAATGAIGAFVIAHSASA